MGQGMGEAGGAADTRRTEITQVATGLFLEGGFAATSMSKVAAASGITKASLYHHFSSKEALFSACVTHGYAPALARLRALIDDGDTPIRDRVRAALGSVYDVIILSEVGRMSPLIAEVSRMFPGVARSFYDDYIGPQQDLMWALIAQGIDAGVFRPLDRKGFQHMVFGPIVTLSMSREMFTSFDDLDDAFPVAHLRQQHIDALMEMLEAR